MSRPRRQGRTTIGKLGIAVLTGPGEIQPLVAIRRVVKASIVFCRYRHRTVLAQNWVGRRWDDNHTDSMRARRLMGGAWNKVVLGLAIALYPSERWPSHPGTTCADRAERKKGTGFRTLSVSGWAGSGGRGRNERF